MFAKSFFFFALTAFVNAAPIIDNSAAQVVRPLHQIKDVQSGVGHELQNIASKRGDLGSAFAGFAGGGLNSGFPQAIGGGIGHDLDSSSGAAFNFPNERRLLDSEISNGPEFVVGAKVERRGPIDLNTFGAQIIDGLESHGLNEYVDNFSARIQRSNDLPSDVPPSRITAEADNLLHEYNQVLTGLHVNKPVEARDIVINPQTLTQLQNFVFNTVNLLCALDEPDAVNTFLSGVNKLEAEARNGTLGDVDLLNSARDILASVL